MTYWVVMYDLDGGESDPEGPFDFRDEAVSHGEYMLNEARWASYELRLGDY